LVTEGALAQKNVDTTQVIEFDPDALPSNSGELHATLTVLTGPNPGAVFILDSLKKVIGRSQETDIHIPDAGLSRRHAQISRGADGFFLEDLGSTNGTFSNGIKLEGPQKLDDGARIQVGQNTVLRFALLDRMEQEAAKKMYELTVRDPLTRLFNRRYLDERLQGEFAYSLRHRTSLCALIIDVDHFKNVNDTFGHPAGDAALRMLAATLQRTVRAEDLLARFGGEEFVVITRGIDGESCVLFAERVRRKVESTAIEWNGAEITITVSIGVAFTDGHRYSSPEALVAAADGALYRAKRNGRNRVERA
jgi:two-component system, cell cycle response regulator